MAGFWTRLISGTKSSTPFDTYDAAQTVLQAPYEPFMSTGGIPLMDPGTPLHEWIGGNADAEHVWRTQPSVRKVIGFAARNVASIPLHVHERVSDTERQRVTTGSLADVISTPRPRTGSYRFWEAVISDGLLYDRWAVLKRIEQDGSMRLSRVPAWRLRFVQNSFGEVEQAYFWTGGPGNKGEWIELDLDDLIFDHGYAPKTAGLTPVQTLRDLLDESAEAVQYRREVWANGARVPQWVGRPENAPPWETAQRDRFVNGMRAYMKDGGKAGGVPLFEDGMTLNDGIKLQSKDMLDLEGRKLSDVVVASAWYIAPELIGAREGTNSNVDAYRQMLYRDSLGPYITAWEQAINVGLTPDLADGRPLYVEANIESKLRGSFLEQAKVMQSATGAPWMLRNEARALQNRPPVDGGDELVIPLNVLVGGQASPRDSGTQNENTAPTPEQKALAVKRLKSRAPETHEAKYREVLEKFFDRQARVVQSRLGVKAAPDWWDEDRWDKELADDLLRLSVQTSQTAARATLEAAGLSEYDVDRTLAFLKEAAERSSKNINEFTREQVVEALKDVDDPGEAVAHVFDIAKDSRTAEIATTAVTFASGFGAMEAGRQNSSKATKTWRVTSSNPRASHAAMDGETVPVDDVFSNGLRWPGGVGDPDEVAGCQCELDVNF